jgi:pyruvate/2-oxoglutarate/acetoin dehydrogenase E1 component
MNLHDPTLASGSSLYFSALCEAMRLCANHGAVFVGQGVGAYGGTTMSQTMLHVPAHQRWEFPVAEDMQMGFCLGASLDGMLPVCIFPRWNFFLLAWNQAVNHLDRLPLYSGYKPKVIIRVAIPSSVPFDPGPQHNDDFTDAFASMTRTINVVRLQSADHILPAYRMALDDRGSTCLVEYTENYKNERAKV